MEMVEFWLWSSLMAGLCFCSELTVKCESHSYKRKECPVGGVYTSLEKIRQLSSGSCTFGYSFGMGSDYVWVDKGCRAVFKVTFPDATTNGVESTTNSIEYPTNGVESSTNGIEYPTNGAESTTHFVEATTNGVWISTTAGDTTSYADAITSDYVTMDKQNATTNTTTTTSSQYDTTQSNGNSGCHGNTNSNEGNCQCRIVTVPTLEEQLSILQDLRKKLRVNKTQLSSFIRKRVSATDTRLSSRAIGFGGVVTLLLILGTIISSDFLSLYRHITKT